MHPVLFDLFGLTISPYGVLLSIGLLAGVVLAVHRARKCGVREDAIMDVAFLGTLAGFAGGRIAFILTHLPEFRQAPLEVLLDRAGFTFLGGLILGTIASIWIIRWRKERFFAVADVIAPSLALAHFFGRLGCFFAGCCYGSVCPAGMEALGVRFPAYETQGRLLSPPALADHIDHGLLPHSALESLPVWPTQLMEAFGNLAICLFLFWLWRRRRFVGHIFLSYLMAYGVLRFLVEIFRGDADRGAYLGVSTSQWLSLMIIAGAAGVWVALSKRGGLEPAEPCGPQNAPTGADTNADNHKDGHRHGRSRTGGRRRKHTE